MILSTSLSLKYCSTTRCFQSNLRKPYNQNVELNKTSFFKGRRKVQVVRVHGDVREGEPGDRDGVWTTSERS